MAEPAATGASKGVKVHVDYCGEYHPLFLGLKKDLEQEFPEGLVVTGEATPTTTGWFEVTVNGTLVHSKENGDGTVDRQSKLGKILSVIDKELEALGIGGDGDGEAGSAEDDEEEEEEEEDDDDVESD